MATNQKPKTETPEVPETKLTDAQDPKAEAPAPPAPDTTQIIDQTPDVVIIQLIDKLKAIESDPEIQTPAEEVSTAVNAAAMDLRLWMENCVDTRLAEAKEVTTAGPDDYPLDGGLDWTEAPKPEQQPGQEPHPVTDSFTVAGPWAIQRVEVFPADFQYSFEMIQDRVAAMAQLLEVRAAAREIPILSGRSDGSLGKLTVIVRID